MYKQLARSSQSAGQGNDGTFVIGAGRIDNDVSGLRRLHQTFLVVQRSEQRLDAVDANRIGFFRERTSPVT